MPIRSSGRGSPAETPHYITDETTKTPLLFLSFSPSFCIFELPGTGGVSHFHPYPTSIPTLFCSRSTSTTLDGLRRWPVGKPLLVAFQPAISEDHPSSLSSVAKRANLVYFGDGSGNTVKTKTNQPPTPQMVLISHSQLRKDKREHAKSSGTEGAIRGGAKSRAPAGRHLGMEVGNPACTPGCALDYA